MLRAFYDPYDWYWLADSGELFSSKRAAIVATTDADFVAWQGDDPKAPPTTWPRDDAGAQTMESLQAVMDNYGITVPVMRAAQDAEPTTGRKRR
jgi:hypothetical protein